MIQFQKGFPSDSLVTKYCEKCDYADHALLRVRSTYDLSFAEIISLVFLEANGWTTALGRLRNILVKPFGLKTGHIHSNTLLSDPEIGQSIAFFEVLDKSDNEMLLSYTDKHLLAWFSFKKQQQDDLTCFSFSTVVQYHNFLGRAYFFCIKPFHVLIIKSRMKALENEMKSKSNIN